MTFPADNLFFEALRAWKGGIRKIFILGYLATAPGILSQPEQQGIRSITESTFVPGGAHHGDGRKRPEKRHLISWEEDGNHLKDEFSTGSFYWYGTDRDGSPTLWYRIERMEWERVILSKRIEYTNLILQSAFDIIPPNIDGINFVMLLDDLHPSHILKHPRLGPAFLRSFVKLCPDGQLKRVVMVTGRTGRAFYKIAKSIGPKSIVERIAVVENRDQAASLLLESGILEGKEDLPSFLGGGLEHDDEITKSLFGMMSSLFDEMNQSGV